MSEHTPRPDPEAALAAIGLSLPTPAAPVAAYIPARRTGNLVFISGQIPFRDGKLIATGIVPNEVSMDVARECAVQCGLNGLAALKAEIGSLTKVRQVVRLGVFVACNPGFGDQPKVANGASELMQKAFGESGRHSRASVGAPSLPLNAPVEVEFVFEVE